MTLAHHDRAGSRRTGKRNHRARIATGELLEDRRLLDADAIYTSLDDLWSTDAIAPIADPLSYVPDAEPLAGTGSPSGFTPAQLRHAYGFDQITFDGGTIVGDGTGQTIAIVNAYHTPTAQADLDAFSAYFGLPEVTSFVQVDQNGGTNYPGTMSGWALETALDVQWAHAFAPGASILLVEANSANFSDLTAAVDYARNVPGVSAISMSWGVDEWSGETFYDQYFTTPNGHAGVTFFGAAGNTGGPGKYPAYSPNVTAVGGTSLTLNGSNNIVNETAWSGSGGGISQFEAKPTWQNGVVTQSLTQRVMPDVAFDANPSTGVPVYDSFNNGTTNPWIKVGGTSFATPAWAALITVANQGRTLGGLPVFDTTTLMTKLYSLSSTYFNDITSGTSTGTVPQSAGVGYDAITGRGTPKAALIAAGLVDASTAPLTVNLLATSDTGTSNSDDLTKLNNSSVSTKLQFEVTGTIAGATVNLYADGTLIGSATATGTTTTITTNGSFTLIDGVHAITARQIQPSKGLSAATPALNVTIDATAPTSTIVAVSPDPRTTPVSSIALQFSEVVSGLNLSALSLTFNAGANLLSGAQSVTTGDNVNWTLNNLTGLTTLSGLYQLALTSSLSPVVDAAGNIATDALESFTVTANVLGRMLFYNQSAFDGNDGAISAADDGAIATDKNAYQAGSGLATFDNISSYSRGINGVMIDITGSHPNISASDFTFRVGSNNSPGTWNAAPAPVAISVRAGAGTGGGDRIEIVWANGAIKNEWLEVTLLPTANTGLLENDVFYFGNRIGDSGTSTPATTFSTTTTDSIQVFATLGAGKPITDLRDYNRDGQVTTTDSLIVFSNLGNITRLDLSTPSAPEAQAAAVVAIAEESPVSSDTTDATAPSAAPLVVSPSEDPAPVRRQALDHNLMFAIAHEWSQRAKSSWDTADVEEGLLDLLLSGRRGKFSR